jgi:hypothetical protein
MGIGRGAFFQNLLGTLKCVSKNEKVMCPKCKKMYPNPRFKQ